MKAILQRVARASVSAEGVCLASIARGLLVLVGFGRGDTDHDCDWIIPKLLSLRIFSDAAGKMNHSITDIGGELLIVSQFTLYGDLRKGARPNFSGAMPPDEAALLYQQFVSKLRAATTLRVAEGKFAAMMQVELINDGPVTILLDSRQGRDQ